MDQLSSTAETRSRKSFTVILRAIATIGQRGVSENIGKSETWVSRFISDGALKTCCDLLAVLGLKIVPADRQCYAPEYIEHLHYFAKRGMEQAKPELVQDFDE